MSMQFAASRRPDITPQRRRAAHPVAISGQHIRVKPLASVTSEEFSEPDLDLVTRAEWTAHDGSDPQLKKARRLLTDRESTISALNAQIASLHSRMAEMVETLRAREAELDELRELLLPAPAASRSSSADAEQTVAHASNPADALEAPSEPSDADEYPSLRRIAIRTRTNEGQSESLPASYASELEFGDEAQFFAGITQDIQRGGLFLATHRVLPIGSRLDLEFELPEGTSVRTSGVVAWVRETVGPNSERPGVGVAFTELPSAALPAIERFCRIHPPLYMEF
jgi:uncharacterized protein (TIGR02266 family)